MAIRTAQEYGLGDTQQRGLPNVYTQEQSIRIPRDAGQLPFGRAAGEIGRGAENAANGLDKYQAEQDALIASDLDEKYQREVMDLAYNPDTGFYAAKGGAAIGLPKTAEEKLNAVREKYSALATTPRQAQLFNKAAERTQSATMESVMKHTLAQQGVYKDERADSIVKLGAEKIALNPRSDDEFQKNLGSMINASLLKAKDKSPEGIALATYETGSLAHSARIAQLMQSENPSDIMMGYDLYKKAQTSGQLTIEHVAKLDSLEKGAVPKALAATGLAEVRNAAANGLANLTPDQIFDNGLIRQESGGRQFAADGITPLTSSAGAIGIAQILPSTGPEAAKDAGLEWDEQKFKTDPIYNAALGKAYYKKLVNKYGDKSIALLAYNWGQGNVDDHMKTVGDPREGKVSMGQFIASIPSSEARNYIGGVSARLGINSGKIDPNVALAKAAELDAKFPGSGETFLTAVTKNNEMADKAEKDYALTIKQRVADQLAQANGDLSKINSYDRGEAQRLGIWSDLVSFKGATETGALMNLRNMPDEEFAAVDLREYAGRLSQDDLLKEVDRQKKLRDGDEGYKTFSSNYKNYWVRIKGDNKESEEKANFELRADDQYRTFVRDNKRPPNPEETKRMLQDLTLKADGGIFSSPRAYQFAQNQTYDVNGLPRDQVDAYSKALQSSGYDINEENIKFISSAPKRLIGAVNGVPDAEIKPVVDQLVAKGYRVTPGNVRALYQFQQTVKSAQTPAGASAALISTKPAMTPEEESKLRNSNRMGIY